MKIVMNSDILRVNAIKHKTQAKLFKNLKEGSKVKFSINLPYNGCYNGLSGKMEIKTENLDTGEHVICTVGNLYNRLSCFEFVKCELSN